MCVTFGTHKIFGTLGIFYYTACIISCTDSGLTRGEEAMYVKCMIHIGTTRYIYEVYNLLCGRSPTAQVQYTNVVYNI